ncbi:hypothetical protein OH807_07765 [Kitasatospora sp. NBC_01560]|uniref:hypothetical protein n=1 Tax=Kitasatospora sp. NBC_01560 TaxID=2975965 RepID=UPI003865E7D5
MSRPLMPRPAARGTARLAARVVPVLALAVALGLATTSPALADPPAPAATDLVGVGAQGTDALLNQLSTDYNAALAAAGDTTSPRLYSWDAYGPTSITTKSGAYSMFRPYNSNAGVTALNATTSSTLDFARSARFPAVGDPVSTLFVAMAKDAVSWAAPTGGRAPASLTTAQLRGIYTCDITNWRQIDPALPDATIHPFLAGYLTVDRLGPSGPMMDSSSFFLRAIGYPLVLDGWTDHSCVRVVERENQGADAVLHDPDAIVPYSVGRYLGQAYGGHTRPGDEPGALVPRAINGIAPFNPVHTVNGPFAASTYGRILFNTVRQTEWQATDAHGAALRAVFGPSGWICRYGAADLRSHGFLQLPGVACGQALHS